MRALIFTLSLLPALAFARNGGIATQSCSGCHGTGAQVTTVTLEPATFNPGDTITVRVTITGSGSKGGFALMANGTGTLAATGSGTKLANGAVVHSTPKNASGGSVVFEASWTAPSSPGGVLFDVATVLANGDGKSSGDQSSEARLSRAFGCEGTTYYRDADNDGVGSASSGTIESCSPPPGFSELDGDCDDYDNRRTPGKEEICNNLDDNCNGQVDEGLDDVQTWPDADGDGYGSSIGFPSAGCTSSGRAQNNTDCNDQDATVHPGAPELCDGKDNNCNGQADEGARIRCGIGWCAALGPTCHEEDCTPGEPLPESCNGLDDDCDGVIDNGDLCGPGAFCFVGVCLEGEAPPDDAGTKPDGGTKPGTTNSCAAADAAPLAILLVISMGSRRVTRRRRSLLHPLQ